MLSSLHNKIKSSPFRNAYWFARHLVNTDQYGAIGRKKERQLLEAVGSLETILALDSLTSDQKLKVAKKQLSTSISGMIGKSGKNLTEIKNLNDCLCKEILSLEDIAVFCITVKHLVTPINRALAAIPSNDLDFCRSTAKNILEMGEANAGEVIATWDEIGVKACLDNERAVVVEEFTKLLANLTSLKIEHSKLDDNILITAFVQEFERRLCQKRKSRGGNSLENAVAFLFEYYNFKSSEAPSHFDQDIEVDKWFQCKDGWSIGISCKRTLRERWKQLSQADRGTLSHFKIRELWHMITYDHDLSDEKIVRLGEQNHFFYLLDASDKYLQRKKHPGMKNYVRPLSQLISDIRENIK